MKEYRAEMKVSGNWIIAYLPFSGICKPRRSLEEIQNYIARLKSQWDSYKYAQDKPTDYRIVSREVSAWKEAE